MSYWTKATKRFLESEDGPTTVEYAVILALIVGVCVGAVKTMSEATRQSFDNSSDSINTAVGS